MRCVSAEVRSKTDPQKELQLSLWSDRTDATQSQRALEHTDTWEWLPNSTKQRTPV
jgi:hypothetical protein